MKPRRPPLSPDDEAIEAMAAAWLAQRDEGLTADEADDFVRWQQADPRHAAAIARLERTWSALQHLREYRPESPVHPNPDLLAGPRRAARVVSFPTAVALAGLAAVAALAAVVWWPRAHVTPPAPALPTYATAADGYQRVTLDDGSVLELNADSLTRVDFTSAARRVELVRGEAHFTVARAPERPFVVIAGNAAVRAVGTAFNVRFAGSEVDVLVTEGRVSVGRQAAAGATPPLDAAEVAAGQRLVVSAATGIAVARHPAEELPAAAIDEALAWQKPRLRFVDTPLAGVVAQFNRHNRIQIELADADLADLPVDGSFRAEQVEAFVRLLEADRSLIVERAAPDRIVLRRAR